MRTLILVTLTLVASININAQQRKAEDRFAGKKLNWLERRYRETNIASFAEAEKRLTEARETLARVMNRDPYADHQQEILQHKIGVSICEQEMSTARDRLAKADELLTQALADKESRKRFNQQLKDTLQEENRQTAAKYGSHSPVYPTTHRTFRIDCYSGGFGRHYWVRCTSVSY